MILYIFLEYKHVQGLTLSIGERNGKTWEREDEGSFGRPMTPGDCELWTMSGLLYLRPSNQTKHMLESPSGTDTVHLGMEGTAAFGEGEVHGNMVLQGILHCRGKQASPAPTQRLAERMFDRHICAVTKHFLLPHWRKPQSTALSHL